MHHVSNRYCQYTDYEFAEIPFEMYHVVKGALTEYYWDKSNIAKLIFE